MAHPVPPLVEDGESPPSPSAILRFSLLKNLTTQTHYLSSLFTLLSSSSPLPTGSSQPAIPSLYSGIVDSIVGLDGLVDQVYKHQIAYSELMRLTTETKGLEGEVRDRLRGLEEGVRELEGMVSTGKGIREGIERSEKYPISSSTLLSTAQNLSSHSSAPISVLMAPQDKAQYMPWPTEGAMRSGILFMMGGSMSGVGDIGKIGDEMIDSKMDIEPQASNGHQTIHEEDTRRYDPNAVFHLELNSDSEEDD